MYDGLDQLLRGDALVERAGEVPLHLALLTLRDQRRDGQQPSGLQVDVRVLAAPGVPEAELGQLALDVVSLLRGQVGEPVPARPWGRVANRLQNGGAALVHRALVVSHR